MVETRRSASAKSKAQSSAPTKQRTLFDLFPAKSISVTPAPAEQVTQDESTQPIPVSSTSTSTNVEDTEETTVAPMVEKLRQTSLEPRPLHPFFTKPVPPLPSRPPAESTPKQDIIIEIEDDETPGGTASTGSDPITLLEESGSQEDPIIVESKPLKPTRPSKTSVSKPLAPLFAPRRPKAAPVPSSSQSPEVVLLELPDEAVKPKLAPIFASCPSKTTPSSSNSLSQTKETVAPFPNKESQHVRGPQHVFSPSSIPYGRLARSGPGSTCTSYEDGSLKQFLTDNVTPSTQISTTSIPLDKDTYLDTIPDEHQEHPAISRFTTASQPEGSAQRLWVDKWRPTHAAEILGNEGNAIYLRDWIRALELQLETNETSKEQQDPDANVKGKGKAKAETLRGTKRPRTILRAVEKKRGKKKRRVDSEDEDDSWIVYDTDYFSSPAPSSPPPYIDGASSPASRVSPPPDLMGPILEHNASAQPTFTSLTNTILLAGPSGSGKTAAVYACAEELGWDVLEVYPGIGRRNGAGIDSLIGDAGKNHHVRKAKTGNTGIPGASDFFGSHLKGNKENDTLAPKGDDGVEPDARSLSMLAPPSIRQSLILIEEVDILFKDDTNFWPAVTNFIKDCRRPVICTCNDISLVPTQDLPLQTILTFEPCAPDLAVSYLQALCFHEDHYLLNRETLLRFYGDSASNVGVIDFPDIPNPAARGDFSWPDLRRTINNLQFLCASASGNQPSSGWERDEEDREDDMCDWNRSWGNGAREEEPNKMSADQGVSTMVMRTRRECVVAAARHAEFVSYMDTYLRRGHWDTREGLGWSACEPSSDDEVGHTVLFCPRASTWSESELYSRDREMASAAGWLARGAQEPTSVWISPCRARELFRARVDHQLEIGKALEGIVPVSTVTMRRKEVRLDYVSRVDEIVAAEDEWERRYVERERTGRMTRNSGGRYERNMLVSSQARIALGRTVLRQI